MKRQRVSVEAWGRQASLLAVFVSVVGLVAAAPPRGALGAPDQSLVPRVPLNPNGIDPALLELPSWALPGGATAADTVLLRSTSCVPTTATGIEDEFLTIHQSWCEWLHALSGVYQDFYLTRSASSSTVGEWAATVYNSVADAQGAVQEVTALLRAKGEVLGSCPADRYCILARFQDTGNVATPSGASSPNSMRTVDYAVWGSGNVVAEVAVVYGSDLAESTAVSYRDTMISNGAVLVQEVLAGEQPAAPTGTPVSPAASPTTMAAPPPTLTPPATAAATRVPTSGIAAPSFSVRSVKVAYGSARPQQALLRKSLPRIRMGQKVKLLLYVIYRGVDSIFAVRIGLRVLHSNRTVYLKRMTRSVSPADNGRTNAYWTYFRSFQAGVYVFSGTAEVGTKHKHKTVTFSIITY